VDLSLLVDGVFVSLPGVVALGVVVGFVAGLFGVGGGFLLTPLLNLVFGVPLPVAVGTGLCLMVGTSLPALLRHRHQGQGEVRFDLLMLVGSLVGVESGARVLDALGRLGTVSLGGRALPAVNLVVQGGYVVLLLSSALVFWRQARAGSVEPLKYVRPGPLARWTLPPRVALPAVPLRAVPALLVAYLGLALGLLSGLLGIGGGVALMPVLIYGFGFPIRQAAGTGILVLVASSALGTFVHALRGNVHLGLAGVLLIGASVSAQFGALATRRLPVRVLRRLFSAVLVLAVLAIVWNMARQAG
jgi:uncharacterized protein